MSMNPCPSCACHVMASACACPHCGVKLRTCSAASYAASYTKAAALLSLTAVGGCFKVVQPMYGVVAPMDTSADSAIDEDGDGWGFDEDCDDDNPEVFPGAEETPGDGVDSNCDGADDT